MERLPLDDHTQESLELRDVAPLLEFIAKEIIGPLGFL